MIALEARGTRPPWVDDARHLLSKAVAAELRAARRRRGLSFRRAGEIVGCAGSHIANLEASRRCPSTALAHQLIAGLKLPPDVASRLLAESQPDAGRSYRRVRP